MKQVFSKRELVHRAVEYIRIYRELYCKHPENRQLYVEACYDLVKSLGVYGLHILSCDEETLLHSIVHRYF